MDWREFLCVSVEVTDFCNGGCIFCDHHRGNFIHGRRASFMKSELFKKIVQELDASAVKPSVISLSWLGESLLHPQICEFLDYINGLRRLDNFHINTNGMFLDREKIDLILDNERIRRIRVSLDACSPETYCRIKSVERFDYNLLIENLRYLMAKRGDRRWPQMVFSFVVCPENELEAEDFMRFWADEISRYDRHYMVTHDFFIPVETTGCDVIDFYMLLAPDQGAATALYRRVIERAGIYRYDRPDDTRINQSSIVQHRFSRESESAVSRRPCASLWRMANIHSSGLLTVCCHDLNLEQVIGDLNVHSFSDLWYGDPVETLRSEHLRGNFKGLCARCGNIEYFSVSDEILDQYLESRADMKLKKAYFKRMGIHGPEDFDRGHN